MAKLKTAPTDQDYREFLDQVESEQKKKDSYTLVEKMKALTGAEPVMWGPSILGFGSYHYVYKSGRENDWFLTGFSPRKTALTIYLMDGFDKYGDILSRLGKFKQSKGCLYLKRLSDIDEAVLDELLTASVTYLKNK